jgi:GntR family transcriptional regulator/MocR family aminotransferase
VRVEPDDVIVTNGAQQAFDLIARVLLRRGSTVALENPGYPMVRILMESMEANVVSVPIDEHGLVVDALPKNVALVYVTPSHQFPMGLPMPNERRIAPAAIGRAAQQWAYPGFVDRLVVLVTRREPPDAFRTALVNRN